MTPKEDKYRHGMGHGRMTKKPPPQRGDKALKKRRHPAENTPGLAEGKAERWEMGKQHFPSNNPPLLKVNTDRRGGGWRRRE